MAEPELNPRKVRVGLIIVAVTVVVAIVIAVVIDDPLGRFVMVFVALAALLRAFLLVRWLKREGPRAAGS